MRKLWFLVGLLLVLVVGIALYLFFSPRKGEDPPATDPGDSPEFDQHLAEINRKWLFLFKDGDKIVFTNIYGEDDETILDIDEALGEDNVLVLRRWETSPDGNWVSMTVFIIDSRTPGLPETVVYIIDLRDHSLHYVDPDYAPYDGVMGVAHWLDKAILLVPAARQEWRTSGLSEPPAPTSFLLYDLDNPGSREAIELPVEPEEVRFNTNIVFLEDSRTLLFADAFSDGEKEKAVAFDKDGLRAPTQKEQEMFRRKYSYQRMSKPAKAGDVPRIEVNDALRDNWLTGLLEKGNISRTERREVLLDGELVRMTKGVCFGLMGGLIPTWDEELQLFLWQEDNLGKDYRNYYMDREGHYRLWMKGFRIYLTKAPRLNSKGERSQE